MSEKIYKYSELYNVDRNLAIKIIKCESGFKPEARNEKAIIGIDIGYWQINSHYWEKELENVGFDIYKPEENLEVGFYLLSKYGDRLWTWSKHCWSR